MYWLLLILFWYSYVSTDVQSSFKSHRSLSFFYAMKKYAEQNQTRGELYCYFVFLLLWQLIALVDDLHCPKDWTRFLDSCYYLSNYMSTVKQSNQTCNVFALNNSRLMYVKKPAEIFYATHIMKMNNLTQFMLEIDPDLMKSKHRYDSSNFQF